MTINVGDTLPSATFMTMKDDGPDKMTVEQLSEKGKVVIIGVPGAFTPTCHATHLPGFVENMDAFKEFGVDCVAVTAVNDVHVFNAWAKNTKNGENVLFLADGNGDFATACGLDVDLSVAGMGKRSKRYAMVVDKGVVTHLNIEDQPGVAEKSSAATLLEALKG